MGLGRARPRRRELRHLERQAWARRQRRRGWVLAGAVAVEVIRLGLVLVERGAILAGVLAVAVVVVPPLRWRARVVVSGLWMRRRFMASARHAGVVNHNNRVPTPVKIRPVPVGHVLRVRMAAGGHAGELEAACPALAAGLGVMEVRVRRDRANAKYADVVVVRSDPLSGGPPLAWPLLTAPRVLFWDPIPVGIGEDGQVVTVSLVERNLLLGGEPGGGKSGVLNLLIAAAALDPAVRLILIDGKWGAEFNGWRGCAEEFVEEGVEEAIALLRRLRAEMKRRYKAMKLAKGRKIAPRLDLDLLVVVIDELAEFTVGVDRKVAAEFSALLRDLVSKGRAAGIIVLAATQRPSTDIVAGSLRALFAFRWALRCSTPDDSDTILGRRWAARGWSTDTVDAADRGVGLLRHEGRSPVRVRAFYLSDDDIEAIAARAEELRRSVPVPSEEGASSEPQPAEPPAAERGVA